MEWKLIREKESSNYSLKKITVTLVFSKNLLFLVIQWFFQVLLSSKLIAEWIKQLFCICYILIQEHLESKYKQ